MKRILTIVVAFVLSTFVMQGAIRSVSDAASLAMQYVNEQMALSPGRKMINNASSMELSHTRAKLNNTTPAFYVFNRSNSEGFVVVSADDRTEDILMYGDNGQLDVDNANPNLRFWLNRLQEEISAASDDNAVDQSPARKATQTVTAIAPLLQTKDGKEIAWYQEEPYWNQCPMDMWKTSERCLTGCVATATAQIMCKWRYPAKGTGLHSYTWEGCSNSSCTKTSSQVLSMDFSQVTFDWDNMLATYNSVSATTAQKNAVATLMYCCGVACNMQYGGATIGGSGAWTDDMGYALEKYFGYKAGKLISTYSKTNYISAKGTDIADVDCEWSLSIANFTSYFNTELEAGRPILMGGEDSNGGHEFVCDGRNTDGKFHINWGWEGESNCYCLLTALKPTGTDYDFSSSIDAFIGIEPDQTDTIHVTDIIVTPTTLILKETENVTVSATIAPQNATVSTYTWSSSNSAIASVSSNGQVVGVSNGTAYIVATATDGNFSDTCYVTVTGEIIETTDCEKYEYEFTQRCSPGTATLGNYSWIVTCADSATFLGFDTSHGAQFGSKNLPAGQVSFTTSDVAEGLLYSIQVESSMASYGDGKLAVYIDGTQIGTTQSLTTTNTEYTFLNSTNVQGDLEIRLTNTTRAMYIKSIHLNAIARSSNVITYTASEKLTETTSEGGSGLHTNAFNVSITSHTFADGVGTITFNGEVTSVGDYAFSRCSSLASITIPNSVTSIGERAFLYCTSLISIDLPNSVRSIMDRAFQFCDSLATIFIPKSVTSIGDHVFIRCSSLTSIDVDAANTHFASQNGVLFNYKKDTLVQYPIGNIRTTYTIPSGVTSIGEGAFEYCVSLSSVAISNSVTSIGDYAFLSCNALTTINIPKGVNDIGSQAFNNCSSLASITCNAIVPPSCGSDCFNYVSKSIPVYVPSSSVNAYKAADGWKDFTNIQAISNGSLEVMPSDQVLADYYEPGQLCVCCFFGNAPVCGDIVFVGSYNEWSTEIEDLATFVPVEGYQGWYVVAVTDNSSTILGRPAHLQTDGSFSWDYQCGDGVQVLRGSASITPGYSGEVDIQYTSTSQPTLLNVPGWKKGNDPCAAKYHNYQVTLVSPDCNAEEFITPAISGGFNSWGQQAMILDEAATYARQQQGLPGGVFSITVRAAEGTDFKFRSSAEWGKDWNNLPKQYNNSTGQWELFNKGANMVMDQDTVLYYDLGDTALYTWTTCEPITSVITYTASSKLQEVYSTDSAGLHLNAFKVAMISHTFAYWAGTITFDGDVTSIGERAFMYCTSLIFIDLPNSVRSIGDRAFQFCDSLATIFIPKSVTSIGDHAFIRCSSLISINVDAANTHYVSQDGVLFNYTKDTLIQYPIGNIRTKYIVPNTVRSVGVTSFSGCKSLTSVTIHNSLTNIGDSAFYNCSSLKSITSNAIVPPSCGSGCFDDVDKSIPVYVPSSSVSTYKSASGWKDFTNIQAISNGSLEVMPSDQVLADYYEPGQLCVCCFFGNAPVCGDIVFVGSYNEWSTEIEDLATFVPVEGYQGWYVVAVTDNSSTILGRPAHLTSDGSFSWDYQCGDGVQVLRGSASITPGYSGEVSIEYTSTSQPTLLNVPGWKKGNDPCAAKYHNYQVTLVSPDCNADEFITPAISGGFNSWGQQAMTLDEAATNARQQQGLPGGVFSITVRAAEGTDYQFRSSAEWGKDWSNQPKQYNNSTGQWELFNKGASMVMDQDTVLYYDLGDTALYTWTTCERPITITSVITYTASSKLPEVTTTLSNGLHTNAFDVAIQSHTFSNGTGTITFDGEMTAIDDYAFYSSTELTSITIPSSVTKVGNYIFSNCTSLTTIMVDAGNTRFSTEDGVLYNYAQDTLIQYPMGNSRDAYTIPNSVTHVAQYAFSNCTKLTSVVIPNSVSSIGNNAFRGCTGLATITTQATTPPTCGTNCFYNVDKTIPVYVPSGRVVAYTNASVWKEFTNIQDITKPNNVITYTASAKLTETTNTSSAGLHTNAFNVAILSHEYSNGTGTITLAGNVTSIGDRAFYNCSGLTAVTIPNSVTSIGYQAFCNCSNISSMTIPASVSSIGNHVWRGCSNMMAIVVDAANTHYVSKDGVLYTYAQDMLIYYPAGNQRTTYSIANSVNSIADYAFYNSTSLQSLTCGVYVPPTCGSNSFYGVDKSIPLYVPSSSVNAYKSADVWKEFTNIQAIAAPSAEDLAKYDTSNNIVLCVKFEQGVCNDVVVMGDYNNWTYDKETTRKMEILEGFDDWLVAAIPYSSETQNAIKPVHMRKDGSFSWDYMTGGADSWIKAGTDGATLTIAAGLVGDEADISCSAPGAYIYKNTRWNNDNDPCVVKKYTITYQVSHGTISGPTTAEDLEQVTLTVTPNTGYHFTQWSDGNTDNPRVVTITQDTTMRAVIAINQYSVTISSSAGGSISGDASGTYEYGTKLTLKAVADEQYRFVRWSDGKTTANRSIVVTEDITLQAIFSDMYILKVSGDNGEVDGAGEYSYGTYVVLIAWPYEGYEFRQWSDGTEYNPHVLYITEDIDLTAYFIPATAIDEVSEDEGLYTIYNASGNIIYQGTDAHYPLPGAGLYIIQHNSTIEKVIAQ